ncbi:MAG: extracellular solute-binding protein, partial [Chloroflexi bacterium]|nr:extracellular solute-binding protein [Chloroflexota bacterium]
MTAFPSAAKGRVRAVGMAAMVVLLAVPLAGCARHGGPEPDGDVVIHAADWGGAASDPRADRIQHEIDAEWAREYPNIHVRMEHIPGSSEYVSKLLTAFVAGTEPDVMQLDDASAATFINNDTLLDLAPYARRDRVDLAAYYPNVLNIARRGTHLYALPADFTPMMIYYNKREFDRAGLAYPRDGWTWDDFLADCKRLTIWPAGAAHPSQYGFLAENWMP